jgi:hypothetical protein
VRFGFKRFANRPVQIDVYQVSRGRRVISERLVKRFKARTVEAKRTHRLKVPARKLAKRGDYRVRITVGRGSGRVVATLVSRKL